MKKLFFTIIVLLALGQMSWAQTYQTWNGTGGMANNAWSAVSGVGVTACSAGPFSTAKNSATIANICVPSSVASGSMGVTFAGIRATENLTVSSPSGTLATGGAVITVDIATGKTVTLAGTAISTAAGTGFIKTGAGTFSLTGAAYPGGFTLSQGIVLMSGNNAMGTGPLAINGGVIASTTGSTRTIANTPITIGGDFQIGDASGGAGPINFTNAVALGTSVTRTITVAGTTTGGTFNGIISGTSANLTIARTAGAGVITLAGINTYSGATNISSGALALSGTGSIANSTSITIGGGATFDVSGRSAATTLAASQNLLASGNNTTGTSTLTTTTSRGLALSSTSALTFSARDATATAPLTVTGAGSLTIAATNAITVTTTSALAAGAYKLVAIGSGNTTAVAGAFGSLTVNGSGLASGTTASLRITAGELFLDVVAPTPTILPATNTFTAFTTTYGSVSTAQTVAVTGTNLTANISVSAGTGFEVSNGGAFGASTSFTQSGGNASGTLSVRLAANASAAGSYNSVTAATLTSTGATTRTYTTSATGNSVAKANATVVVTPYSVTYDGNPHTATVTSITGVGGETGATVGSVDVTATTHTNAGTTNDTWVFTPTANYNTAASGTNPVTDAIAKANATVVVTPYSVTYDGNPHTATVTSITGVGGETGATVGSVDVTATTHTNAGSTNDTWVFTPTANYNTAASGTNPVTDVISQLGIVVTPDAGQSKAFGAGNPTYTYSFAPALISPDVITGLLGRTAGEAVGFYAYNVGSLTAGGNYSLSLGGSNTFQIVALGVGTADFRSKANGNFNSFGVSGAWEYDQGGGSWVDATQAPLPTNNISITHNITLDQDYTVGSGKTFVLGTGGTLVVNPTRTLSVTGSADFGGKSVTFTSDATGTASLGEVAGTLTGATNVTVERFIRNNGFRSWRLLSVPVTSAQTIRQAWQEGDDNPLPKDNNVAGKGTQITGVFTTQAAAAAAGFDSTSVQAGMLRWNGASWTNVVTTNQPINNFSSWFLYIRGDRAQTVTGTIGSSSSTTLRTKGTVFTGDRTNSVGASAFALIPNEYPSAINFTGLTRTGGVNNLFYIWDSKKQSGSSLGVYQTFSNTNSFNCLIAGGSYTFGSPNTTIESGQSFFVTSGAAGTIVLKESAKISGTNGSLGFRPSGAKSKIDTRLYNSLDEMADANTVVFDAAYDKAVAEEDAPKLGNPGANFAIETGNKLLAIEGTEPVKEGDAIQFRMWNLANGSYTIELAASNFSLAEGLTATLEDSYLKTSTAVSLTEATKVKFEINSNSGSSAANRFKLVFAKAKPVINDGKQAFTVAPNPIENGVMNVSFKNQAAGKYSIRLAGAGGQSVMMKAVSHAGGNATQNISLPSGLASGTYTVEIVAPDKTRTTQTVVVNRK